MSIETFSMVVGVQHLMITGILTLAAENADEAHEALQAEPFWLAAAIIFELLIIGLVLRVGLRGKKKKKSKTAE